MDDLLIQAAKAWKELLNIQYNLTYGRKRNLFHVSLIFQPEEFYHVAGFNHLNDIVFPIRFSHTKALDVIIDGRLTLDFISKSEQYEMTVKPRLEAIIRLQALLDGDFVTYIYNQKVVPFYSRIEAKYLITNKSGDIVFMFTDEYEEPPYFYTRSAFMMGERDFRKNQKPITLLTKEKKLRE